MWQLFTWSIDMSRTCLWKGREKEHSDITAQTGIVPVTSLDFVLDHQRESRQLPAEPYFVVVSPGDIHLCRVKQEAHTPVSSASWVHRCPTVHLIRTIVRTLRETSGCVAGQTCAKDRRMLFQNIHRVLGLFNHLSGPVHFVSVYVFPWSFGFPGTLEAETLSLLLLLSQVTLDLKDETEGSAESKPCSGQS
jgi:hypothetical protein